jgi:hypothetical protein
MKKVPGHNHWMRWAIREDDLARIFAKAPVGRPPRSPVSTPSVNEVAAVPGRAFDAQRCETATHSPDFTDVNWYGTPYRFDHRLQAQVVKHLWWEHEKGHGLGEGTIGELIGSSSDYFQLMHVFRVRAQSGSAEKKMHPAWGTMIVREGPRFYRLREPKI